MFVRGVPIQFDAVRSGGGEVRHRFGTAATSPGVVGRHGNAVFEGRYAASVPVERSEFCGLNTARPVRPRSNAVASAVAGSLTTRERTSSPCGVVMVCLE